MITALRHLFSQPYDHYQAETPVSFDTGGADNINWQSITRKTAGWQSVLGRLQPNTQVGLFHTCSVEFLAALLAIWRAGAVPVLPSAGHTALAQELSAHCAMLLGEFDHPEAQHRGNDSTETLAELPIPNTHALALILFTSGSSGSPKAVSKTFAQLEGEIHTLESTFGAALQRARISAGVSHQHIYGLLFRLLWPLCTRRSFACSNRSYWEQILADGDSNKPWAIVTSPAQLSHLPPVSAPAHPPCAVFSSGAPLAAETAHAAEMFLQAPVTEVYGSTETGGVGWRRQSNAVRWQAFDGVTVAQDEDSTLLVSGKHLGTGASVRTEDYTTFDTADPRQFTLHGRADRIAKIGGKRVSLTELETRLNEHPLVQEARVTVLETHNSRTAAVVVLNSDGKKSLINHNKRWLNEHLRDHMRPIVEPVALPRYWRYVEQLPISSEGKTTQAALAELFRKRPSVTLPQVLAQDSGDSHLTLSLRIPPELSYFEGHFPGQPILPGVVQTHWAIHYARQQWSALGEFTQLEAVKFQHVIRAGQQLTLTLEFNATKGKVSFHYKGARHQHASGRVAFNGVNR